VNVLSFAAASSNEKPFTSEEIQWIAYYAKEMSSLVDRLSLHLKPQSQHQRQSMQDYADASEAVLALKNLSNGERQSVKDSVKDVRSSILDHNEASPDSASKESPA
jgi:hypothetical protein